MKPALAIDKPAGKTSAQVIRDLQSHFNPSQHFAPWLAAERARRASESSHEQRKRRKVKQKVQVKIGHGGTLDPDATGVLILGIGSGTKLLNQFLSCTKTYETVALFGAATDTYDASGKVVQRKRSRHITKAAVQDALSKFRGNIMQRPPAFSAIRLNGKRLYEYAREGGEIPKIEKRPVNVEEIELIEWMEGGTHDFRIPSEAGDEEKTVVQQILQGDQDDECTTANMQTNVTQESHLSDPQNKRRETSNDSGSSGRPPKRIKKTDQTGDSGDNQGQGTTPRTSDNAQPDFEQSRDTEDAPPAAKLRLTSSSGFYVRSLCHDLGTAVDSLGLMASLVRTRQAHFALDQNVLDYNDVEKGEEVWAPKVGACLKDWESRESSHKAEEAEAVAAADPHQSKNE